MRPTDVAESLRILRKAGLPAMLSGPPGGGKSSIVRQSADRDGVKFMDVRVLLHDQTDLKFPVIDSKAKSVTWVQSLFPSDPDWEGVVCLEELDKAPPSMQAALLGAVLEREIGGMKLPKGMAFVACCNRAQDRAGGGRMITPLLNRFAHLDLDTSLNDWLEWSLEAGVHQAVRAFMPYRPALLHDFRPDSGDRSFPSPRSWEFVSRLMQQAPPEELVPQLVSGCVGDGAASEFVSFLRVWQSLPDIGAMLASCTTCKIPAEGAVLYALAGAITDRSREDTSLMVAAGTIATRMPPEFAAFCIRDLTAVHNTNLLRIPAVAAWLKAHHSLISRKQ